MTGSLAERVFTAHGDVWQLQGRLRAGDGGGVLELAGIRLMASGIALAQWNNGDVTDPSLVDLAAVRAFYAERRLPWGVRLPAGTPWPHGRLVHHKRAMAAPLHRLSLPDADPAGVRRAAPADLDAYVAIDTLAFDEPDAEPMRRFIRPLLAAGGEVRAVLAQLDGRPVGVGYAVRSDSPVGGASVGLFGIGVLPEARRRGVGTAVTVALLRWGVASGADLAWLNPDTDQAAALYARLGFTETSGIDVYADNCAGRRAAATTPDSRGSDEPLATLERGDLSDPRKTGARVGVLSAG